MTTSGQHNKKDEQERAGKKRSILGLLFNPRIDRELGPLQESAGMFVRMIALVFASYDLFPRDHAIFKDPSLSLSLRQVIAAAYSKLSFTRQGIPQVAVFVAVVGCLLFSALFIFSLIFSLFVGSAHAQVFESSTATNDWAIQWIEFLFRGEPMASTQSSIQAPTDSSMQQALGTALSYYSTAVLALAGFLLIYHLVTMVTETAYSGKVLGARANQIWAPIRLIFAIGMLVPIGAGGAGTGTVTGYNTAQYLAMQFGRWGSGLASNVWQIFLTELNTTSSFGACTNTTATGEARSPSCIYVADVSQNLVRGLVSMDACAFITNFYINQSGINRLGGGLSTWSAVTGAFSSSAPNRVRTLADLTSDSGGRVAAGKHFLNLVTSSENNFTAGNLSQFCGGYEIPQNPGGSYSGVYTAQINAFNQLLTDVHSYVAESALKNIPSSGVYAQDVITDRQEALEELATDFQQDLATRVSNALSGAGSNAQQTLTDALEDPRYTTTGWLMAGSWFNEVTRLMAQRSGSMRNALPTLVAPSLSGDTFVGGNDNEEDGGAIVGVLNSSARDFGAFMRSVNVEMKYINQAQSATPQVGQGFDEIGVADLFKSVNPVNATLLMIDKVGTWANLWSEGGLALQFGSSINPLAEVAAWGQNMVSAATVVLSLGGTAYAIGMATGTSISQVVSLGASEYVSMAATFIGGTMITIASLMYLMGFTFAFLVPLFPFYRFFFGSLQWIMSVFEAIVLAPLFALAHVSPYGEGLAGPHGKYGYSVIMQVLLRPVLMVFGLIAGYLLFSASLHFLNNAFVIVTQGTGAYSGGNWLIAKLVYSVIYCVVVLILANQCFSTIGLFPQVALSYLGMQGIKEENIDTTLLAGVAAVSIKSTLTDRMPSMVRSLPDQHKKLGESIRGGEIAAGTKADHKEIVTSLGGKVDKDEE